MKNLNLALIVTSLFTQAALAEERVIFDRNTRSSLSNFELFLEDPQTTASRPGLELSPDGIRGRPGNGNFTAHRFVELNTDQWKLRVTFEIPRGVRYSNSGIYLLYQDPQNLNPTSERERNAFDFALAKARQRRDRFGAGPFELDFFSHELQIISGTDATVPPENHGAGAFYGVDLGSREGTQRILNSYDLFPGDTYELILENQGDVKRTYLRSVRFQEAPVLVSEFVNLSRSEDPVRGGSPKALLLQAFYNNGRDVQLPVFHRISIEMN